MLVKIISLFTVSLILFESKCKVMATVSAEGNNPHEEFHPEDACFRQGGICGLESFCPSENQFTEKGLCPLQQSKGVECCRSVPLNIRDCRKRGGECLSEKECGRAPREAFGVCPPDQICCILLI